MKKIFYRIIVLSIVGFLSGFILSVAYDYATPKIEANREKAIQEAIYNIMPKADRYNLKEINGENIYFCYDNKDKLTGYVVKAEGMGYQGNIIIMVGIDKDLFRLTGIQVLEHSETPGLGAEIVNEEFKKQFRNLNIYPIIEYVRNQKPEKENQIKAITGATFTSKSIVSILNDKISKVLDVLEKYNEK